MHISHFLPWLWANAGSVQHNLIWVTIISFLDQPHLDTWHVHCLHKIASKCISPLQQNDLRNNYLIVKCRGASCSSSSRWLIVALSVSLNPIKVLRTSSTSPSLTTCITFRLATTVARVTLPRCCLVIFLVCKLVRTVCCYRVSWTWKLLTVAIQATLGVLKTSCKLGAYSLVHSFCAYRSPQHQHLLSRHAQ